MNSKFCIFLILFFTAITNLKSQTVFANKEWVQESPVVGTGYYHTSTVVSGGNIYVTGNKLNGSGNTDIYTIKINSSGDTVWTATYNGSATGSMDYGIELQLSSDGFLYVIGAAQNSGTGYDYCLLKYNTAFGTQVWARNWNGAGNGDDIPSSLRLDGSTSIYVTGGSEASNGFSDFGTIRVSNLNSLVWTKYYDHNDLHDGATAISITQFDVVVSGGSAEGINDWDLATVRHSKLNGNYGTPNRTDIAGATMTEARAMVTDTLNNIYITGFAEIGGDKNMQVIKLDSNLSLQWIANYSGSGDDIGEDLSLDSEGNVYVAGHSEKGTDKYKGLIMKFNEDGDTLWTNLAGNTTSADGIKFRKIVTDGSGNSFVTGSFFNENHSYVFAKYNSDGFMVLTKVYENENLNEDAFDIGIEGDNVYITGFSETVGGTRMSTVKYSIAERDTSAQTDSLGNRVYMKNHLLVRVDTSLINHNEVNQLDNEFWNTNEIFDPTFVNLLNRKLEDVCNSSQCKIRVYRIFDQLKTTDTITYSRLGKEIRIPNFWATFIFEFPDGINIEEARDSLLTLFPYIHFVDFNLILSPASIPNDPEYYMQYSLHPADHPDYDSAHVNVEPAWAVETGESFVRVGVYDSGINQSHDDFENLTGSDHKIAGGWDYAGSGSDVLTTSNTGSSHGTACGGIIGANRNDDYGVAGIAGGDYQNNNPGVSLYDFRILNTNNEHFYSTLDFVYEAIIDGALDTAGGLGYGLHIMNNSWFIGDYGPYLINYTHNVQTIKEAVRFTSKTNVVFAACRGNFGSDSPVYPATIDDKWVLSVGGTGADGEYYDGEAPGDGSSGISSYGLDLDLAAPASGYVTWVPYNFNEFIFFGGTSAATPHVVGALGLIMSYYNYPYSDPDNLSIEDCEQIVQLSADDTDMLGYDDLTGYGRLNIGRAISMVAIDDCFLQHYGIDEGTISTITVDLIATDDTIKFADSYTNLSGVTFSTLPDYRVNTFKITIDFQFPTALAGDTLRAIWERHSSSNLFGEISSNNQLFSREEISIISYSDTTASIIGFVYEVREYNDFSFKGWAPFNPTNPNNIEAAFTVYRCDTNLVTASVPQDLNAPSIDVFPNPSNDFQVLRINNISNEYLKVNVYDFTGREIMRVYDGHQSNEEHSMEIDLSFLSSGIYFYNIQIGERFYVYKIIKQ